MTTFQEAQSAIKFGGFTNDQLTSLSEAIRYARSELGREVKRSLDIGDNVTFTSSRTGRDVTGHVTKIAVKYVTVRTVDGLWKVPSSMLTKLGE